jgi:hypothetical protein
MLWIFAIALFVVAVAAPGGPLLALGLLGGGYFLSIHLHPYTQCDACKGTRAGIAARCSRMPSGPATSAQGHVASSGWALPIRVWARPPSRAHGGTHADARALIDSRSA